ncbi:PH domain-containing protein [Plastoroseomonas arctica]|uniref:PH domain-containing protein n=1 Tax=Plastoroseomonas arctica TaxID=1509237 RepID=A0AAF1JXX2_9PROT|nr:PH domain-containing protein [Plastoroseomonas arctica]MBR0656449.1 PH domain-containing protein [Plastoroseomonas arctica]
MSGANLGNPIPGGTGPAGAPGAGQAETMVLEVRESRRSFGLLWLILGFLMLGIPFIGRQRVAISNQRVRLEQGFWTRVRDDIEIFRIRDVVVKQNLWHRLMGVGDIVIRSTEGRTEETHVLRGLPDPDKVSDTLRSIWNSTSRPRGPATSLD